jgi:hypothetical protein
MERIIPEMLDEMLPIIGMLRPGIVDKNLSLPITRGVFPRYQNPKPTFGKRTLGRKMIVGDNCRPLFPELAMLAYMERRGWRGFWVDTFHRRLRMHDDFGGLKLSEASLLEVLPGGLGERVKNLTARNGGRFSGCWDVLAFTATDLAFVEMKESGNDRVRQTQIDWYRAAIKIGIRPESFRVVEWAFGPHGEEEFEVAN